MRNILLENSYTKCSETIPQPFSNKISRSIVLSLIQFVFIVCQAEGYQYILKLSGRTLALTSYKAFLRNKKWSGTSSLPNSFPA